MRADKLAEGWRLLERSISVPLYLVERRSPVIFSGEKSTITWVISTSSVLDSKRKNDVCCGVTGEKTNPLVTESELIMEFLAWLHNNAKSLLLAAEELAGMEPLLMALGAYIEHRRSRTSMFGIDNELTWSKRDAELLFDLSREYFKGVSRGSRTEGSED